MRAFIASAEIPETSPANPLSGDAWCGSRPHERLGVRSNGVNCDTCYSEQEWSSWEKMSVIRRFTSADLELFPENDGKRYEIIDGELYVSRQPHLYHQFVCDEILFRLQQWSNERKQGRAASAPGLIFADDDDVAPDLVWMSTARMADIIRADGKLHAAPELIVEVLSPGAANEKRDRELKQQLYSRRGVGEYWVVDWRRRRVELFRRRNLQLELIATLTESDILTTPLLPDFSCRVADLFACIPTK